MYNRFCARCHVFGSGLLPDLRRLSAPTHQLFYEIVLNGAYRGKGMARWDDVLSRADAESILPAAALVAFANFVTGRKTIWMQPILQREIKT